MGRTGREIGRWIRRTMFDDEWIHAETVNIQGLGEDVLNYPTRRLQADKLSGDQVLGGDEIGVETSNHWLARFKCSAQTD